MTSVTPSTRAILALFMRVLILFIVVLFLTSDDTASAQEGPASTLSIAKQTWVVGRDTAIGVTGQLPVACAGTTVEVALYTRGPAAVENPHDELFAPVTGIVGTGGSFKISLPLPAKLQPGLRTAWLGVAGPCLSRPLFSTVGPVYFGVADPVENKDFAGTFVIPAAVLGVTGNIGGGTLGQSLGMLTALTDGTKCTTVDLVKGPAIDAEGNAHIHVGGPNQPAACSRDGATISFVSGRGGTLFEKRTLMVGVSQPFANLAPEPPDGPMRPPVIVEMVGILPPGPVSPIRTRITWLGEPSDRSYELERSSPQNLTDSAFKLLATIPASQRGPDGFFSYTETAEQLSFGAFVCYRVRAVSGGSTGVYSPERCSLPPVRDGGTSPLPPVAGTVRAVVDDGIPRETFIVVVLLTIGSVLLIADRRSR